MRRRLRDLRRHVFDHQITLWYELPLDARLRPYPARFDAHLDLEHPEEVLEYIGRLNVPGTNDRREISRMRARGHLFGGVRDGDGLVGFIKLGWGVVYVLDFDLDLVLPEDACFVIDAYLEPGHRGRGGGRFMVMASSIAMRARGFRRRIAYVYARNASMRAVGRACGYRPLGTVRQTRVLGRRWLHPHPAALLAAPAGLPVTAGHSGRL